MGVSTDAKLVFGFEVDEDDADACAALMDDDGYDRLQAAEKKHGVSLVYHCSDECTEYIVGVERTLATAHRGYPREIHPELMVVSDAERDALDAFADEVGLKKTKKAPKWLLASYWG